LGTGLTLQWKGVVLSPGSLPASLRPVTDLNHCEYVQLSQFCHHCTMGNPQLLENLSNLLFHEIPG